MPNNHGIICRQSRLRKQRNQAGKVKDKPNITPDGPFDTVENRLKIISVCVNQIEQTKK